MDKVCTNVSFDIYAAHFQSLNNYMCLKQIFYPIYEIPQKIALLEIMLCKCLAKKQKGQL